MFLHSHFQKLPANNILYEHHPTHNDVCRPYEFSYVFLYIFLYHDFLFMRGSRIGEPVIPQKQNTTDSTDTNQMATTINYFIIHCCQPNPSFIERNCCYHYYKCHSNRYPPGSQCIFVYYIGNSTWNHNHENHQDTKCINKYNFHDIVIYVCKYTELAK